MLKPIVLSVLLCGLSHAMHPRPNVTVTKEVKLFKPYSTTIVNGSSLLTISANRTHITVNTTNSERQPCVVKIDKVEHPIQKQVKAATLGDKILVWGVRARYEVGESTRMDYTLVIVDPKQCSYKPVSTYEEETLGFDVNRNLPEIVVNDDESFDVYYSTMRTCTPCRYSKDGKRLDLAKSMKTEPPESSVWTLVRAFKAPELGNGYVYAHSYGNGNSSVLRYYTNDFKLAHEKTFNHKISALQVTYTGDRPAVVLCGFMSKLEDSAKESKVLCRSMDAKMDRLIIGTGFVLIPHHDPLGISLAVDPGTGNSYLTIVETSQLEDVDVFSLHKMKPNGYVSPSSDIYKLGEMPRNRFDGSWQLRGLFYNGKYCYEMTKSWSPFYNPEEADEHEAIKCVDV